MKIPRVGWRGALVSAAVIAAAAGTTFGALALLGGGGGAQGPAVAQGARRGDRFAVCVDVYDPGGALGPAQAVQNLEEAARTAIMSGFAQLRQHPLWQELTPGRYEPSNMDIDIGCPSPPLAAHPKATVRQEEGLHLPPGALHVAEPSYYRLFVFVAPLDQIDKLLGGTQIRIIPQEIVRYGVDGFRTATYAIYVAPEELSDVAFISQRLEEYLGFRLPGS